jgi:hypothetical protein
LAGGDIKFGGVNDDDDAGIRGETAARGEAGTAVALATVAGDAVIPEFTAEV